MLVLTASASCFRYDPMHLGIKSVLRPKTCNNGCVMSGVVSLTNVSAQRYVYGIVALCVITGFLIALFTPSVAFANNRIEVPDGSVMLEYDSGVITQADLLQGVEYKDRWGLPLDSSEVTVRIELIDASTNTITSVSSLDTNVEGTYRITYEAPGALPVTNNRIVNSAYVPPTTDSGGGGATSNPPPPAQDPTANQAGLVPCGDGNVMCTPCELVALAQRILNFFVFAVVIVAALLFVNAGVLYLFAPASPANISKAHRLFIRTLIGLIIVLAAFLFIDFAMKTFYGEAGPADWGPWNNILCN